LSAFEVNGSNDQGYGATNSVGGSRINTPLGEVPNSTTVLNELVLHDLGANDLSDALSLVSGVALSAQPGAGDTAYSLRGYAQSGIAYRDGLPDHESVNDVAPNDSATYDRIEVIKGPAGVLYGSNNMGGIVNRVSKMPRDQAQTLVQLQGSAGADNYLRAMLDSTGPTGTDGRGAYRVVVAERDGEHSWGGRDDRFTALLAYRYEFGAEKQTRVWVRFLDVANENDRDQGTIFTDANGQLPDFFRGRNRLSLRNFPLDGISTALTRAYEAGLVTSFRAFGVDWTTRIIGRYNYASGDKARSYAGGIVSALDASGKVIGTNTTLSWLDPRIADWRSTLIARNFEGYNQTALGTTDLVGHFELGPTDQTLILNGGENFMAARRTFVFWNAPFPTAPAALPNTYSLLHPQTDLNGVTFAGISAGKTPAFNALNNESEAHNPFYAAQDSIAVFSKRLIGVIGARYDTGTATAYTLNSALVDTEAVNYSTADWTYKLGLVGLPIPGASIFANDSTTYQPVYTNSPQGTKFPDQNGRIMEAGVKTDAFDGRLVLTASVFDMRLTNVLISVPNPASAGGGTTTVPEGIQKTRGWETDVACQPIPAICVLVDFSNLTSVNATNLQFRGVPDTPTFGGLVKYSFVSGAAKGFAVAVKYDHVGQRPGDAVNSFTLPELNQVDLLLSYAPTRNWDVIFNIANLTDNDRPATAVSNSLVTPQFPRTCRLTFNWNFR
jgi:iron complex outermembrane receptor protein